jgi:16S rRNA (guanine527-N7)-methyltransferase
MQGTNRLDRDRSPPRIFLVMAVEVFPHPASPHRAPLEALGLREPAAGRLAAYLDVLAAWSLRVNLTGARGPAERVHVLVAEVLPALTLVPPGRLIDVGSGNGSPGLVYALVRDDLEVTLLEPRQRRWAFLREAARAAGRSGVDVRRQRHDTYTGPAARTVTLRALAVPLAELAGLVEAGGRVVVLGGRPTPGGPFVATAEGDGVAGRPSVFRRTEAVSRET